MTPQFAATQLTLEDGGIAAVAAEGALTAVPAPPVDREAAVAPVKARHTPAQRRALTRRVLVTADLATGATVLAAVLASAAHGAIVATVLVGLLTLVVLLRATGLYDRDHLQLVHSTLDEVPRLAQVAGLATLSLAFTQPVLAGEVLRPVELAVLWAASWAALVCGRVVARSAARRLIPEERCLVVGSRLAAEQLQAKLGSSDAHATLVAQLLLDDDGFAPMLSADDFRHLVSELAIDRLVLAPECADDGFAVELIRAAKSAGVPITVLPRMLEVVGSGMMAEDLDGLPVLAVRPFALPRSAHGAKRVFDLVATLLGFLVVGPVLAVIAVAIRLDTRGPVFYRQRRVGRDGQEFDIIKFRSMAVDADHRKEELRGLNEVGEGMFKLSADPRVTTVGRFLRRTSLDELPQLLNVLRGEMSLVGPRPLVVEEDRLITGLDRGRLHLTPGMTGPWQVLGTRAPMHEMLGIDYQYVASWSLWGDVKLLLRTVRHVLRGGNV